MEFKIFKAKNVDDAIMEASINIGVASDELVYEIIEKGSNGFLGIAKKPAIIKARAREEGEMSTKERIRLNELEMKKCEEAVNKKLADAQNEKKEIPVKEKNEKIEVKKIVVEKKTQPKENKNKNSSKTNEPVINNESNNDTTIEDNKSKKIENVDDILDKTNKFLTDMFSAMKIETKVSIDFDTEKNDMNIDFSGEEMGILIGKRGQTLDSLQYLISLFVNKMSDNYIRVKVDTENYRARRKETLENLAHNIAYKVKRSKKAVYLEPMNPYERRIIHSTLQNDKFVYTKSEGEDPYRKVVVLYKR